MAEPDQHPAAKAATETPESTVANADQILLPKAAEAFHQWKANMEKSGIVVPSNLTISFSDKASRVNYEAIDGVMRQITLPERVHRWTVDYVLNVLSSEPEINYKSYNGSAAVVNIIAAIASKGGVPMPLIYKNDANNMEGSPAISGTKPDGTGYVVIDPAAVEKSGGDLKGIAGHEIGHLADVSDHNMQWNPRKAAEIIVAIHNDPTDAVARSYESRADAFAVKVGAGEELKAALIKFDKAGMVDPNDSLHPKIEERIKAIDAALSGMQLPEGTLQHTDDGHKSPAASPSAPVQPDPLMH